jgi:hypothetical protein
LRLLDLVGHRSHEVIPAAALQKRYMFRPPASLRYANMPPLAQYFGSPSLALVRGPAHFDTKEKAKMSTACLFISWNRPVPGRDNEAYGMLMREGLAQIEKFHQEKWFESYEVIGLTPHNGTTNGFILLKGERAKLDELRRTDPFERFSMQMGRALDGYGVVPGVTLEGMRKVMERNPDMMK